MHAPNCIEDGAEDASVEAFTGGVSGIFGNLCL